MELEKIDIHELLPQQEPFVMVGMLTHFDERVTTTQTVIREDNIFVENGFFTASGIIENIAQTCAARIGYVNKYILQKRIQFGFIGALRNLTLHRLPSVGEELTTSIEVIEEVFGMTLVKANVISGDSLIATSEMKIALSGDVESSDNL